MPRIRASENLVPICKMMVPRKKRPSPDYYQKLAQSNFRISYFNRSPPLPASKRERLVKILYQIVCRLDAHGQPHQPVGDAEGHTLLARHGAVAGGG